MPCRYHEINGVPELLVLLILCRLLNKVIQWFMTAHTVHVK
jgi:hypothetical protein